MGDLYTLSQGVFKYTEEGLALYKPLFEKGGVRISSIVSEADHFEACITASVDTQLNDQAQRRHINPGTGKPTQFGALINELLGGDGSIEKAIEISSQIKRRAGNLTVVK
jgi:hypothetical protein